MPVVGFNFSKILVEKNKPITKDLKVTQNLKINEIDKSKSDITSTEILRLIFEFNLDYQDVGKILMRGDILYTGDKKEITKVQDEWKKNKKLPPEVGSQVFNTILFRCNIKALTLQQELNLPYHINLPRFKPN